MKENNSAIYNKSPSIFLECDGVLPYEKRTNKFCNNSCAAKYNNRKTKQKLDNIKN
jgi:hypothetical protein